MSSGWQSEGASPSSSTCHMPGHAPRSAHPTGDHSSPIPPGRLPDCGGGSSGRHSSPIPPGRLPNCGVGSSGRQRASASSACISSSSIPPMVQGPSSCRCADGRLSSPHAPGPSCCPDGGASAHAHCCCSGDRALGRPASMPDRISSRKSRSGSKLCTHVCDVSAGVSFRPCAGSSGHACSHA